MKSVILTASTMKKTIKGVEFSGKCVTALNLSNNKVLRLVRNKDGAPMENPYCDLYKPLEVHDLSIIEDCPLNCQTENVLADYKSFNYVGKYSGGISEVFKRFNRIKRSDPSFMLDGTSFLSDISLYNHSLELIKVSELSITGKRCSFKHKDIGFNNLMVKDPDYSNLTEEIGDAFLAISIPADNYKGFGYFKFVASVFPIEGP